jgi:hypothetical protein
VIRLLGQCRPRRACATAGEARRALERPSLAEQTLSSGDDEPAPQRSDDRARAPRALPHRSSVQQTRRSLNACPLPACPPPRMQWHLDNPARLGPLRYGAHAGPLPDPYRTAQPHGMARWDAVDTRRAPSPAPWPYRRTRLHPASWSAAAGITVSLSPSLASATPVWAVTRHRTACVWRWWQPSFGARRPAVDLPLPPLAYRPSPTIHRTTAPWVWRPTEQVRILRRQTPLQTHRHTDTG